MRLLALLLILLPSSALAGNRDGLLFGNDAALSAGAVVATGKDGGLLWYNPAALGTNDRRRFNVGGSAFVLRFLGRDEAFATNIRPTEPPGRAPNVEFLSVPTTSTFMLQLRPGISLALGSFVQRSDRQNIDEVVQGPVDGAVDSASALLHVTGLHTSMVFGAGLGFEPSPAFRVGFSLFAVYDRFTTSGSFALSTQQGDETGVLVLQDKQSRSRIGLDSVVGLQLAPVAGLRIGLTTRTPRFAFLDFGRDTSVQAVGYGGDGGGLLDFAVDDSEPQRWGFRVTRMPVFTLGVGWEGNRWSIALEGDLTPPLLTTERGVRPRLTLWNVRLGGKLEVTERVELGAGLFTDRTDEVAAETVMDERLDWYGATFGVRLRNPVPLADGARAESLLLISTFALRGAMGWGQVTVVDLEITSVDGFGIDLAPRDVVHAELSLHIGTALHF